MSEPLLHDLNKDGVLRLTLNRPHVHNAFDEHQIARLHTALVDADNNADVRVVVLRGSGNSFCAGADINYMQRMGSFDYQQNLDDAAQLAELLRTLANLSKPTIAEVQGAAFGGGVGLVCCCDIAIGSERALFCLSEVKIGLVPATIGPYVVRATGERHARHLFISAERVKAEAALRIGLLHELVEGSELADAVERKVGLLLKNSPAAMRVANQLLNDFRHREFDKDLIQHTVEVIAEIRQSPDGREGTLAFLEKRTPDWQQ